MPRIRSMQLLIFISLIISISSIYIGRVSNARLLPGLKNQTAWLFNQPNANICLCNAIKYYSLSNVAALNSFSQNQTCQIILSPPVLSPKIVSDSKSSLILLQPLTDAPCCSDLSWLLYTIKNAVQQFTTSVTEPTTLSISSDNTYISTMKYNTSRMNRLHRNNITLKDIQYLPSGYACTTVFYRNGYIFFGCDTPLALVIFNETNLTTPIQQISMSRRGRGISFARNDSLMFVAVQDGSYFLYIYNITWQPSLSISLVKALPSPSDYQKSWTVHTVNDSVVLLTSWDKNQTIYTIRSPSTTSSTWNVSVLMKTKVTGSETLGEAVVDSCGRLWEVVYGYGIRIFDPTGTVLLANWTLSDGLSNILLLDNYELLLTDFWYGLIYQYKPNIQCTS